MRINNLQLTNFGSHRSTKLSFSKRLALIVGSLNAGKSTIQQGIEMALTGQCENYRRSKLDDPKEIIHAGADRFDVVASTSLGEIRRGRSTSAPYLQWKDAGGTPAEIEARLAADLKIRKSVVNVCLNTMDFFSMEVKDQRDMLISLMGIVVSEAQVLAEWSGPDGAYELLPSPINSISAIDGGYKFAYDERTLANRKLKDLKPPPVIDGEKVPPIEQIRTRLAQLEEKEKSLIAEIAQAKGASQGENRATLALSEREERELKDYFGRTTKPTKEKADELKARIADLEARLKEASDQKPLTEHQIHERNAQLAVLREAVCRSSRFTGLCVIDGTKNCPVTPEQIMARRGDDSAKLKQMETLAHSDNALLREINEIISSHTTELANKKSVLEKMRETAKDYKVKSQRLIEVQVALQPLREKPAQMDLGLTEKEKELQTLQANIAKGRTAKESAQDWVTRENTRKRLDGERKELQVRVTKLDALCEFLGPHGIKTKLVDEKIAAFQTAINTYLAPFEFLATFTSEPWGITAKGQPFGRLSRSERFRAGVALQVAIAKWSSFCLVVVDNAEILVPAVRQQMVGMLQKAELDQAIIIWTTIGAEFKKPPIENMEFFMVRNESGESKVDAL